MEITILKKSFFWFGENETRIAFNATKYFLTIAYF